MKAASLKKGDTIGIISTSCWVEQGDLDKAKTFLESKGYKVLIHTQATNRLHQSAGDAQSKADALHDLFKNPDVKAIIGSRGGNRCSTIMDKLDFNLIASNPKIILGYSDMTILLNAIHEKTGLVTFHGPLLRELPDRKEFEDLIKLLEGQNPSYDFSSAKLLKQGKAQGKLIGGNLSLLQAMSGTDFQPCTDGAILFIEDTGDHISRYDRMFAHMKLAGWFNKISGVIIGQFTNTGDDEDRPFGFSLEDIIKEHFEGLDIPIIMDAPFGHGDALPTMPIGSYAELEADDNGIKFSLTEPAVQP